MKRIIIILIVMVLFVFINSDTMYMNIMLGTNKIGWYASQIDTVNDKIKVHEQSTMSMIVYGNKVNMKAENLSVYDKKYNIIKFFSNINSEQMSFYINGYVNNNKLITNTNLGNNTYIDTFDITNKKILFNIESADKKILKQDNLYIFNPLYRKLEKIEINFKNDTTMIIKSQTMNSILIFNKDNQLIKSISAEGLIMERTDSIDSVFNNFDIVNYFLIKAEGNFKNIKKENKGIYILESVKNRDVSNYRQKQNGDTVIVYRDPLFVPKTLSKMDISYIKANKEIKEKAKELTNKYKNREKLLKEIMKWVSKRINSRIVSGLLSVDEILNNGYGDCTEHAQIFASLAKECGFDVDIVSGIVYSHGYFYYHAWNRVLYNNKIYTIDPTFKQFNADITHIQLSEGFPPSKILIGNLEEQLKIKKIK